MLALGLLSAGCAVPGPAEDGSKPRPQAPTSTTVAVRTVRTGPMTPTDHTRITADDAAAIVALGASGAAEPVGAHRHGHGGITSTVDLPLFTGDAATFAGQWLAAERAVDRFDTVDEARALGFVRASAPGPGVGTHWVRWQHVGMPFDPAEPPMLLFDETAEPPMLVGFVYWVQDQGEPVGFAGGNDRWHQHTGLCVVNGWVDREEAGGPDRCAGTYLAGGDLWMLHAWVVPGFENRLGRFADIHPALCPARYGTPDIVRCPEV